ncbi:hypothetical protein Kfla_3894 [Kribbella flavida DSM 17836]|uniref:Uncharacterized protein n=1 Tax=Kribbella flavida (strain DSM 17836 / JCM 10339 / NBRC 14399) TaxID=479435 RepID=D2PQ23_KRIFD|nr:hypothetical protein [Kribbella flavida]ADB32947.1 hypothetical protein Kfla_3894 [Kribbella flavida DSM 17836]
MSTSQVNPPPFDGPERDDTMDDDQQSNSISDRAEDGTPLTETGLPDPDDAPVDEDPDDQLLRD